MNKLEYFLRRNIIFKLITAGFIIGWNWYIFSPDLYSQSISRVGTAAASFLKIGVGSRAMSMGEAYTTLSEDASGVFWNPAGLANMDRIQMLYYHYNYVLDVTYDFGAVVIPTNGLGSIGAFIGYINMGEIERTTIEYPEGNGERVSASSFVFGISYGYALTNRFSIGGNAKYVREDIWHSYASSYAVDIGLLYKSFFMNTRIAMSITNFGSNMKMEGRDMLIQHDINENMAGNNPRINAHLDTDEFPLPILFRVGVSNNITKDILNLKETDWTVAFDVVHPSDNKEYINLGTELSFMNQLISLRAGYHEIFLDDREGGISLGAGLKFETMGTQVRVDFAAVNRGRLGFNNILTLIISL